MTSVRHYVNVGHMTDKIKETRYINVRQFLKNFNEEIKDLPIVVTKYGQPLVGITDPKFGVYQPLGEYGGVQSRIDEKKAAESKEESEDFIDDGTDNAPVPGKSFEELKSQLDYRSRCFVKFCKNPAVQEITYENPETLQEERNWVCEKHLKEMQIS